MTNQDIKVFRFKLSEDILSQVSDFSKKHQFDKREDYKKAWEEWYKNNEMIEREGYRLETLGFKGDLNLKLYKAGRYYFRKKSNETKEPKKRDSYIKMESKVIESIDEHIKKNYKLADFKPASGYINYLEENEDILFNEIKRLILLNGNLNKEAIENKIKKTYKNRYFVISRS